MKKLLILSALIFAGCTPVNFGKIENRPAQSTSRVTSIHAKLSYENNGVVVTDEMDPALNFMYESKIAPPDSVKKTYAGSIQATSVAMLPNDKMVIAYNTKTDVVEGGFDIVDIADTAHPVILHSYVMSNLEFADVRYREGKLYLAGAKENQGAVLLTVDVSNFAAPVTIDEKLLSSYYVTSISLKDKSLVAVSGDKGEGYVYEIDSAGIPQEVHKEAHDNLLYVQHYDDTLAFLSDNSNGKTILTSGGATIGQIVETNLRNVHLESPARFDIGGHIAYINMADEQVIERVDLTTKTKLPSIAAPGRGNGIQFDNGLLYTAQGEEGFKLFDVRDAATPVYKGRFNFSDRSSANNVWTYPLPEKRVVVLADGLGGVKIITQSLAIPPNYCTTISSVVSYSPKGTIAANRKITSNVLGEPTGDITNVFNFLSLGFGGELVVSFDPAVKNVSGPDLQAFETSWGPKASNEYSKYPEQAKVYGSNDLVNWTELGMVKNDIGAPELGYIELGQMASAKYIKLVDATNKKLASGDGYDLDAMKCLNQENAPVCDATENKLKNGSFETPSNDAGLLWGNTVEKLLTSYSMWDIYSKIPSWVVDVGTGVELQTAGVSFDPQDGKILVELDGHPANGQALPTNTKISQTMQLNSGDYKLSVYYKARVPGETSTMRILVDNVVVKELAQTNAAWNLVEVALPSMTAGNHKISFEGAGSEDAVGALIDNAKLVQVCK